MAEKFSKCPFCGASKEQIEYVQEISDWTTPRYICRSCKTIIHTTNLLGNVVKVSGIVLTATVLARMVANPSTAIEDLAENIIEVFL